MYPELGQVGPFVLRTYTLLIDLGVLIGLAMLAWRGHQIEGRAVAWLDAGIGGVLGGVIGARALHVALFWDYFRDHPAEIVQIWTGGLEWHGALAGALAVGYVAARWRRLHTGPLTDTLALAFPVGAALAWSGCLMSNCAYGAEVRSLADFPPLVVAELADIYGTLAPRYNTQVFGIAWSLLTLALAVLLTQRRALRGRRLWAALAFYSLGALFIGGLRADPMPPWGALRADQWLDLAVTAGCLTALVLIPARQVGPPPDAPPEANSAP